MKTGHGDPYLSCTCSLNRKLEDAVYGEGLKYDIGIQI